MFHSAICLPRSLVVLAISTMAGYPPAATTGPVAEGFQFPRRTSVASLPSVRVASIHLNTPHCAYMCVHETHGWCSSIYTNTFMRLSVCVATHRVGVSCAVYHASHRHSRSARPVTYSSDSSADRTCQVLKASFRLRTATYWMESNGSSTIYGRSSAKRSPANGAGERVRYRPRGTATPSFRSSPRS